MERMKPQIALFAGSFDPIHIGHMALANYILYHNKGIEQLWFVPTAQNPLKPRATELSFTQRCHLIEEVIANDSRFSCCRIEETLPAPHYTIYTLDKLREHYPQYQFILIMGADNWLSIEHWYHWRELIEQYPILVYPRPRYTLPREAENSNVTLLHDAPLMEISSSEIRSARHKGEDLRYWMPRPELFELL